jgi:regulator of protease activity HflC (stomatin/prohibitin superfamily)
MQGVLQLVVGLACVVVFLALFGFRIVAQYERGIVLRFGKLLGETREPGLRWIVPGVDRMIKVDLRIISLDVPKQDAITRDNVPVKVDAVVFFKVVEPIAAIIKIRQFYSATSQLSQTLLRAIVGKHTLDELLTNREQINLSLREVLDKETDSWGVKVDLVEVKDVALPESMQRAIARQAEAEREKRAKIIHAQGEFEASQQLSEAARVIGQEPATLQLRYLQTLVEIASERNSTILFPLPIDIISFLMNAHDRGALPQ